jgi:hypothetical protein
MAPERKCRRLICREYANPVTTQRDLQILYMIGYTTRWDTTGALMAEVCEALVYRPPPRAIAAEPTVGTRPGS